MSEPQPQIQDFSGTPKNPANGQFVKGHSGNPGGITKEKKNIIKMCQNMSEDVINILYDIVLDAEHEHNGSTRIMAGQEILNRGFGKPGIRKEESEDGPIIPPQMIITMSKEDFDEYEQEQEMNNDIQ